MQRTATAATLRTATLVAVLALAVLAEPATAATGHLPTAVLGIDLDPVKWVGDGIGKMKDVVLGPLQLGAKEIAQLIGTIVLAILDMLVPDWIVTAGPKVIAWIVEVENWGRSNGQIYRSINGLQGTLKWIGIALMTSGGTWSALRVLAGHEAVEDVLKAWGTALFGVVLFRWGWSEATAITNSITDLILTQPGVATGLTALVTVVGGTALATSSGLVLPLLMIVAVIVFIGLLAAKTMLLIVGALVYVTGQFAFALRVWPAGHAILKAWWSLAAAVFMIPVAWTLIFAVGGVMIVDALRVGAGGVIEADAGKVFQSWMLAVAAIVTIVAAIKAAQAIFAMAKTAPLALISSMGSGGMAAAGASRAGSSAKGVETALGGRSAGQAAQALRSSSERSMDSAAPATGVPLGGGKQELTVRAAHAAGTYFGGPAAGAAAAAVTQHVVGNQQDNDGGGTSESSEQPASPGGDIVPPAGEAMGEIQTAPEPGGSGAAEPGNTGSDSAEKVGSTTLEEPATAEVATAATNGQQSAAENSDGPQPQAASSDPPPASQEQVRPPAAAPNGATPPIPGPVSVAGLPAEPAAVEAASSPPAAPAAANRSIAGLPTGDARAAFGIPDTKTPEAQPTRRTSPAQPPVEAPAQPPQREPRTESQQQGGGGER